VIAKAGIAGMFAACLTLAPALAGDARPVPPRVSAASGAAAGADQQTRDIIGRVARTWFQTEWRAYAATFVSPEGRIVDNGNGDVSHSEGQGYGLLLAALADDGPTFQTIWSWTQKHMQVRSDRLLAWKWDGRKGEIADTNNATDGDILVAWALAEGARRFSRSDYRDAAKAIAEAIGSKLIQETEDGAILLPAATGFGRDDQPDGPVINLSYWVFPAFPVLKDLAPDHDWDGLRENGMKLLARSRFGPLHLPSDWQSLSSDPIMPAKAFPADFGYNAIRLPLYLAWEGSAASRRALRRFDVLWRGKRDGAFVIDVATGMSGQAMEGAGYRLVIALTRCLSNGQTIDPDLIKTRDRFYYPDTLRLLTLAAIQERYPQCL
jgi:endo-1,4-beta-D-glucanase Y